MNHCMSAWSDRQIPDAMWHCCFGCDQDAVKTRTQAPADIQNSPQSATETENGMQNTAKPQTGGKDAAPVSVPETESEQVAGKPCPPGMCADYRGQLEESILDELCDAGFYAEIANEAPTEILKELIISIVGDEYGHARLQAALLGVCPPPISDPPNCPSACGDFEKDVQTAITGELGAIGRYATLAACAPTYKIRYLLTSILGDEYAHARIWTAMLQAPCLCRKH
jgi:rubrerythrin